MFVCMCAGAYAQTDTIRYVHPDGVFSNDGLSWATAMNKLQDAINDLRDYLQRNNLTSGSVYVAAGTYVPTESTESFGGTMLNTSFKIYSGIHVYGGFNPAAPESSPGDRMMVNGKRCSENWADPSGIGTTSGAEIASQWDLQYKTILSGNHSGSEVVFTYDSIRGRFNTSFPACSYHVVWFATNGTYATSNDSVTDHFRPLEHKASLDGCVITSGNASTRNTNIREHTAFGGGVYMVGNSQLRNCTVERCNATLRGGGIYMDGGGEVEFCYVHTCQSAGVGVVQGYGGGVCIEHEGSLGHSHITNCAARCGGGLLICHVPSEFPVSDGISYYSPFATACVINNNTASAEGGGIYLAEGGTINHCTVTGNNCIGPDVTYYGRRHGRSGGIYIRNCGMIFNSVFWGNKCASNNDIQFASVRQVVAPDHEIFTYHSAFMNHDISDWTGVTKEMVFSLDKNNLPTKGSTTGFPCFFSPTVDPTDWHLDASKGIHGAGVFIHLNSNQIPGPRIWHLTSYSALDKKGVQVTDAVQDASEWIRHAHTDYGVVTNPFEPASTLGALVRKPDAMSYALVPQQGAEGRASATPIPTLFIDPNRTGVFDTISGSFVPQQAEGNSWETPIKDLGEAISYFRQYLIDDAGVSHHYELPALDENGLATGAPTSYDFVQILIKEGTLTTAGPGNYLNRDIRTAAVRVESHMRLYGGYPTTLKGTDTSQRNPRDYVTTITSNITGISGQRGYENNSAHVIAMVNVERSVVDGFTLADANTHNVELTGSVKAGGGILVTNSSTPQDERIHMVGNRLRNCVITNCSAPKGAAIYVNGEHWNSSNEICYAELMLENCVIRNNKADYIQSGSTVTESHGVITANGRAYIHIEHCDIVNNVGYPFKADSKTTDSNEPIYCQHDEHQHQSIYHGYIRVDNSIIFCNGDRNLDDRGSLGGVGKVTSVNPDGQAYVFGLYNMFDADLVLHQDSGIHCPRGFFSNGYTVPYTDHFMPDGVSSHYTADISGVPQDSLSRNNKCIFTRVSNTDPNYPTFVNPSRNVGTSTTGDKPLYGGNVSYAPLTTNPCVNAAYVDSYAGEYNYDRTDNCLRNRGGAPDVGAVENADLPVAGSVIYVTPDGAGKRDGSSWGNAIAGNTIYALNGAGAAGTDQLDAANGTTRIINTDASIGTGAANGVLTTDDRYQGGFARSYFTAMTTGGTSTTTVRKTWTTETKEYQGGPRDGETEIVQNHIERDTTIYTISPGSTAPDFVAGWNDDIRYPYGEISGQSRGFWRATGNSSPVNEDGGWLSGYTGAKNRDGVVNVDSIAKATATGQPIALVVTNERLENYVSGLQYAVERASATNKTNHNTTVQVWVGAGKYTDYKGYIMRDSVTVMGGFPASIYAAPGLQERQALMSAEVTIPQADTTLNPLHYETILQVSDINPRTDYKTFNANAKFFSDDDLAANSVTDTRSYEYLNVNIVRHLEYSTTIVDRVDSTARYIQYANMTGSQSGKTIAGTDATDEGVTNGVHYKRFGNPNGNLDCWHLSYPEKTNYVANIENDNKTNWAKKTIYNPATNTTLPSSEYTNQNWIMIGNGSLTGLTLWQDLTNVTAGDYQISVDIAGGYRNAWKSTDTTMMFFRVYDANGTKCAEANIQTYGRYKQSEDNNYNRNMAYRHVLTFNQPTTGPMRIAVEVEDGVRNKGNTYPKTSSGGDPDPIPSSYVSSYGGNNPNRREFWISNLHLYKATIAADYVIANTDSTAVDSTSVPHQPTEVNTTTRYTVTKSRTTLRKRVLQMPDVCNPMFAYLLGDASGKTGKFVLENSIEHVERVDKPTRKSRGSGQIAVNDPNYKEYNEVYWDGFTIRHGFLYDQTSVHAGGAGVSMYEGSHLLNCIITDNIAVAAKQKGGGFFCDGSNATVEGCFILNNSTAQTRTEGVTLDQTQLFAGGMFLYNGTCFNSLIANNYAHGFGGGLGLCVGNFYNNTVAYNVGGMEIPNKGSNRQEDVGKTVGGVRIATGSTPAILMANTILYGNSGLAVDITAGGTVTPAPFMNCYVHSMAEITRPEFLKAINSQGSGNYGAENILINNADTLASNTPFAADVVNGVYTGGAKKNNNFALRTADNISCVNKGTEDFEGVMEYCLSIPGHGISSANQTAFRQMVDGVELPPNDVVYAKRIQDCQVDIGAYEFNAAYSIKPDTITHPGKAIFYVSFDSQGGDASASSPKNAACKQKLQLIIDAAGRYKNNLMTQNRYDTVTTIRSGWPSKDWTVEVWMEGDSAKSTRSDQYDDWYTPTRSTKHNSPGYQDNPLDYSFIIPRGVQMKGGYKLGFYHYENANGVTVVDIDGNVLTDTTGMDYHIVDDRDPLTYRTVLSGRVTSTTGAEGQCYHVITFTKDLFTEEEDIKAYGNQLDSICSNEDAEKHRAVIDGLFIMDGNANSPDEVDCIGAGAVVTDYAHIRNCVVQMNEAKTKGGGLYLKPMALVSGTIIKKNEADIGGGLYIEAPVSQSVDSLARVYATTICENSASSSAGGMWFDNTNARVNSTAIWQNSANDNANVSGSFTRSDEESSYPFSFCAVESRRLEGQGNIELSPRAEEGVRWDPDDPFKSILYYPISMSSTLSRAGMTYNEWYKAMQLYPTLDSIDIAGVSRTKWLTNGVVRGFAWGSDPLKDTLVTKNNAFIEIGARALNKTFEINVDQNYVMMRLFVMHTEYLNTDAAYALQQNTNTDSISNMYRQMGSCILNPFHRLGDAFDYIIAARKANPAKYRNARFEVYLEQGTYFPYHNALGEQDHVRTNTFLIPEATTVIGGVHSKLPDHNFCQAGYVDRFTATAIPGAGAAGKGDFEVPGTGYTLNYAPLDSIRMRGPTHRPMRDNNLNSVIEPWELERQSVLSGNAVAGEDFTHVYHVITIHADSTKMGPQPFKYRTANGPVLTNPIAMNDEDHFDEECKTSILARTIELDGIQITGGYANHLDTVDTVGNYYRTKTYYRGGGILIDGNWKETYNYEDASMPQVSTPAKYNIPILIQNCVFTNNMAGLGGAIYTNGGLYLTGSHFTQNYSRGPMTPFDQNYMPLSMGGCIASNSTSDISNTLFANNEARRGLYPITFDSGEDISDPDARQGFGGALVISKTGRLRAINCHFVRNKGVAYPAVYNFLANNHYQDTDSMQFVFNSLFWGNEVFEVDNIGQLEHVVGPDQMQINAFNDKYKASRKGVFHYDGDIWRRYEKLFTEYDTLYTYWTSMDRGSQRDTFAAPLQAKLRELRQVGDSMEGLYFCSYRQSYGPKSMKATKDGYLLMNTAERKAFSDPRQTSMRFKLNQNNERVERYDSLFSYLRGNNNVLINPINNATDGPNFKQPSFVAGIDGYMQNADWLLSRMNITTDQGWGHLRQAVSRGISYYITKYTGTKQFASSEEAWAYIQDTVGAAITDIYPIKGMPEAEFMADSLQKTPPPIYNYYAKVYGAYTGVANPALPIGDQYYMNYTRSSSDNETSGTMTRISSNPKMGETDVYIDMGIYEYQYVQLDIKGQEIDTMWVTTRERGPAHEGLTWESPTTDLQTAIETLMSSYNNHDKYICFINYEDDAFSPQTIIDNRCSFVVSSGTLSPLLPDSAQADFDYSVRSLTFLGGYNYDNKDAPRDPLANPAVMKMQEIGTPGQRNQLFVIEDMTRKMLQANFQGESMARDKVVIPIVFDGITFMNPHATKDPSGNDTLNLGGSLAGHGGAAIYYRWQRQYEDTEGSVTPNFNLALYPDSVLIDNQFVPLPKLTISNCKFMDNGAWTTNIAERSPAIFIGYGGGGSLVVNSLFHSNAGASILARKSDYVEGENNFANVHNPVTIVNSTFALNGGHMYLGCEHSEIHNSLIWKDDLASDTTVQLQIDNMIWDKNANKNRVGIANQVTNNAFWGCFQEGDETYHNDNLSSDNKDIFYGPNFIDPIDTATIAATRLQRDFRLNPGLRTMNMADTTVYRSRVFFRQYPDETATVDNDYWRRSNGFKSRLVASLANDSDLAAKPRLSGIGMERGAYECMAVLQRILYVQPNLPASMAGDGSSWQSPFGQGQLQNALDAAAVYTYLNRTASPETQKAYVFVKGSYNSNDPINLIARDGVSVYGSLPSSFNDTAWLNMDSLGYTNGECQRYVNYVRSISTGVASPNASPTRINSLAAGEGTFNLGFVLDGFVITNPNTTLTASPVVINKDHTVVRNCLFTDNKVNGAPIADVRKGLLYNSLFYNDSAQVLVRVGENGLALNNTIVASKAGVEAIDATNAADGALQNNITLNSQLSTLNCFASYLTRNTPYTLPSYLTQYPSLSYQLHEHSSQINGGNNTLPALFDPYIADSVICFWRDRDILGNPRKIGGTVDNGAFETWRVEPKTDVEITALTNEVITENDIKNSLYPRLTAAFKEHYGGNAYPHPGSVVYLMDSAAMTMQYENPDFDEIIFRPGFMLLKSGASFYGNGHDVQMNYLATEKRFVNQRYSMTALPYDYSTANITTTNYIPATDSLNAQISTLSFNTYLYSGADRSDKHYVFQTNNSSLWRTVTEPTRTAMQGYLFDFGATTDTVLRFTAFAPMGQYVYTENGDAKIVQLTQYDNRTAGVGAELNFTKQENMGWNMKGLPWLVSDYRTDTLTEVGNFMRQMYIPHVFYQMDGTGEYLTAGDQIYSSRSWDNGAKMSMGNAFLTQTATTQPYENVIFNIPYYERNKHAARPLLRMSALRPNRPKGIMNHNSSLNTHNYQVSSDILTVMPDINAPKHIQYHYGRDGVKWTANDSVAAMYLLDSKRLNRLSLLGAAPTEVDIPLGVYVPQSARSDLNQQSAISNYTFSLPEKEAFADYRYVWLIDYQYKRTINLLEQDYETQIEPGTTNNRFALRFGPFPLADENGKRSYVVFTHSRTLFVRGLIAGDEITVFAPTGQLVYSATAATSEWQMPLPYQNGYIVKVNDTPHKVLNM